MSDDKSSKAAALRYKGQGAPVLLAKGEHIVAQQIKEIARENDIPLVQDDQLTELLCHIPLGEEIPENLYHAVAEILAYVFRLNTMLEEEV